MSVAHIGKLQENTAALCKIAAKSSGWALSADPDMSDRGSWNALFSHPNMSVRCETSGECGTSPCQNFGCETSGWNGGSRFLDVTHPGGKRRQPDGMAAAVGCKVAATWWNGGVSRMEFLPGWNVQDPILLVLWICLRIPKNSPQSRIALVIKKLSKHQNLTQFD